MGENCKKILMKKPHNIIYKQKNQQAYVGKEKIAGIKKVKSKHYLHKIE